jgi:hypothetical protein
LHKKQTQAKKNAPPTLSWRRFVEKLRETKSGASAFLFASAIKTSKLVFAAFGS